MAEIRKKGDSASKYRRLRCITALLGLSSLSVSSMGRPFLKNILRILYTDMTPFGVPATVEKQAEILRGGQNEGYMRHYRHPAFDALWA